MKEDLAKRLMNVTAPANVLVDEPMKDHTTFKVGGCADVFVTPQSIREATDIVRLLLADGIPYTVIGNGSNLLVSDRGYRGCIVSMGMSGITVDKDEITAGAGALLSKVSKTAYENALTGLEFASGIPGSVGGAVVMNAGAYGGEMKDVITSVTLYDPSSDTVVTRSCEEMKFGYRTSLVKSYPYVVLETNLKLTHGSTEKIKETMDELAKKRRDKQPLEYASAGSTFKRPEGYFAGKLIEDAGLKGYSVGGACVSEKHCGFVVNKGNACADDVIGLIRAVRQKVYDMSGVMLEPEVVILGEDMSL